MYYFMLDSPWDDRRIILLPGNGTTYPKKRSALTPFSFSFFFFFFNIRNNDIIN